MSSLDDALKALGQLFIIGFNGLELSDETSAFISQAGIGGVIYFTPNYENPGQISELSNQVQECRGELPLWVCIDYEGGRVQRFKKHFTKIPDAASVGAANSPRLAFEVSEVVAKELRAVGINVNFAPVCDIATSAKTNPGLGNRVYGPDEDLVSKMSSAVVRGHLVHGVQPCVKHFPGHGDTSTDSHFALPRVDTTLETLRDRELKPFTKAFKSRCSMVMTAHLLCTKLDPQRPATLSPLVVRELLRKELRYGKVVITDDMEMKAITDHFGAEDAPRMALEAGCDQLIYRTEAGARHAYAALVKALEGGKLDPGIVLEAAERVRALKKDCLLPYQPVNISELPQKIGTPEHLAIAQKIPELPKR